MTILRVLIAAVLACTGHAGASVLVAVLLTVARVIRTLLPAVPQLAVAGALVAIAVMAWLAVREIWSFPHVAAVAR